MNSKYNYNITQIIGICMFLDPIATTIDNLFFCILRAWILLLLNLSLCIFVKLYHFRFHLSCLFNILLFSANKKKLVMWQKWCILFSNNKSGCEVKFCLRCVFVRDITTLNCLMLKWFQRLHRNDVKLRFKVIIISMIYILDSDARILWSHSYIKSY